jgi:hypothetical protein
MKKNITKLIWVLLMMIPVSVVAAEFWKSGNVNRVLIDAKDYGKCMINVSFEATNGCYGSWVSLDCEGKYSNKGDGDRMLNTALIAQNMNKKVSIKISDSQKYGGYCVVTRLDLY